ncbi:MAG: ribosome recycling factor [Alphaproteobacteria bacterium]|nr:ribosome recycling factor [Alphaproteobacteria bacterium]
MMLAEIHEDLKKRMSAGLDALRKEFTGLRTGRANPALLEHVKVDAYGSLMPISQVGIVSVPEARLLTVQVWDKGMVKLVEKAIRDANLGVNPVADGQTVRVMLPEMTSERRAELVKVAAKYAEGARVAIRNVRRDGMEQVKKHQKAKEISEDEERKAGEDIQKLTDDMIKKIDEILSEKEKEILHV